MKKLITVLCLLSASSLSFAQFPLDSLFFYVDFNGNALNQISKKSGTLSSGATYEADRHSTDSSALYVDGSNDYVDFGSDVNVNLTNIRAFSVSFWVQPEDINFSRSGGPSSGRYTIFGDIGGGAGFRFFQEDDEIHFSVSSPTDKCYYQLSKSEKNNWLHVVGVSDSGDLSIYVNGSHVSTVSASNSSPKIGSQNFEFGRGTVNNTGYWEGRLDEVRMYNRVISRKEIATLYQEEKKGVCFENVTDSIEIVDTTYLTTYDTVNTVKTINDTTIIFDTTITNVNVYDTVTLIVYDTTYVYDTLSRVFYDSIRVIDYDTFRVRTYDTLNIVHYDSIITKKEFIDTVSVDDTLSFTFQTGLASYPEHEIKLYTNSTGSIIIVDVGNYSWLKEYNMSITAPSGYAMWTQFMTKSMFYIDTQRLKGDGLFNFNVYDEPDNLIERKALMIY